MKTPTLILTIFTLFLCLGCQTKKNVDEVDVVIKTFNVDTSCIYGKHKVEKLTIVSIIDTDSLVFNYILMHSKNKIDTNYWCVRENITFIRKNDSIFRVVYGDVAYPLIYSTDTLKMYLGQINGSSRDSWRVKQYRHKLYDENRHLFSLINNKITKKRTFNIFRDFSKKRETKHDEFISITPPPPRESIYIEGDSCDIINANGNGRITIQYYCTDKYPNNPCSPDNNRGHRKTILQLEGLLLKHLYMVQEQGVMIKLSDSNEKIENPYDVIKFLTGTSYYHLPEDKSIHKLTYE